MARRALTTEEFIHRARKVFKDYDYSKVDYKNNKTKVTIICPKHGEFLKEPAKLLLRHSGCPTCNQEKQSKRKFSNTEDFIKKAKKVHKDKYDYSKVDYKRSNQKVCIICPKHGEFLQAPSYHLQGHGCPKCGTESRIKKQSLTTEEFIKHAKEKHGDKFDYSKVDYKNASTKVTITCNKCGTTFQQRPDAHLNGKGCRKCADIENSIRQRKDTTWFIERAKSVHGDRYGYDRVNYKGINVKVKIYCKKCRNYFEQTPASHLRGSGCRYCKFKEKSINYKNDIGWFIKKSNSIHSNKYTYDNSYYNGTKDFITITCPVHGDFVQLANNHLLGKGCPKCANVGPSKPEIEIQEFIQSIYDGQIILNDRNVIAPYELDIYLPDKNVAIEFDGLYWHSDKIKPKDYHINKTNLCREKGIQLFHIFENEWQDETKRAIWKSVIKNKLGFADNRIYARKCRIVEVNNREANAFCEHNHLQGECISSIRLGLEYEGKLVSLMTFGKARFSKDYDYELIRFCSLLNTVVIGGASKLLSYFRKHYIGSIISYANLRWSDGNLYETLGFKFIRQSEPNYFYFRGSEFKSRVAFQKHRLKDRLELFDSDKTEYENMIDNGYNRIYDCGNLVYELVGSH